MKKTEAKSKKNTYDPKAITLKWQSIWEKDGVYQPDLSSAKKPFFNLMMFPYPSAEGLHIGGIYTFTGVDAYGRFKRMQGYDVFEPMGLDGFGIHSENHAIKTHTHPIEHAERTEKNFYRQLRETGNAYAWENKLETYDPGYYRWTQWLFIELFKAGLAYKKESPVNFCPSCKTVLADEQVIDGACERCSSEVEKRNLEQWFFKITSYADRLLGNVKDLNWTDKVKLAQKNWIGKKTGINISYKITDTQESLTVFTTRPDTNFGATFIALAPEHPFVTQLLDGKITTSSEKRKEIENYLKDVQNKSSIERMSAGRAKSGVFTGFYAENSLTNYQMPIWISDFVLLDFGTGALVGVPAHDKRDFEFATKFGLEIKRVVVGKDGDTSPITSIEQVQEEAGNMINSGFLDGVDIHKATEKIMDHMEEKGYGERVSSYHLRDWLISRQRYWGPPIPMIYCESCAEEKKSWFTENRHFGDSVRSVEYSGIDSGQARMTNEEYWISAGWYPVPDEQLPVVLPHIEDYKPMGTGKAPLANYPDFYEVKCPHCGKPATRETDVSDTFLDSAWYFLRYLATDLKNIPFPMAKEATEKFPAAANEEKEAASERTSWLPVTMYIGGAEHSVLHLLYARFTTMVLHDLGYLSFEEPFSKFYAHGLIIKDGAKMSKSKGNVINPDEYIAKYGVDTVRLYLRFLGPFSQGGDFRDSGIEGMHRFVKRVWFLLESPASNTELSPEAKRIMHQTIKGITEDMEALRFNTAIAKLMTWYNSLAKQPSITKEESQNYLKLIAPFAPHLAEELWEKSGGKGSIHVSPWPVYHPTFIIEHTVTIAVQINGKLRATFAVPSDKAQDKALIEKTAREDVNVIKFLEGKEIRKVIVIPGKVVNVVI
ncbi:MAG: class I tRNA ligase family protein [Patescibacteria group bacterium]